MQGFCRHGKFCAFSHETIQCDLCQWKFRSEAQLKMHMQANHVFKCENCDFSSINREYVSVHKSKCNERRGFATMNPSLCRFYMNGFCKKGQHCRFSHHNKTSKVNIVKPCRYDIHCIFLANGNCKFFHPPSNFPNQYEQDFPELVKSNPPEKSRFINENVFQLLEEF